MEVEKSLVRHYPYFEWSNSIASAEANVFLEGMTGVLPQQIFGSPPDCFYLNQFSRLRIDE